MGVGNVWGLGLRLGLELELGLGLGFRVSGDRGGIEGDINLGTQVRLKIGRAHV